VLSASPATVIASKTAISHSLHPASRYYISSVDESVEDMAERIRNYWHVENKVHYVRDVTQREDASRIRVHPLPNLMAIARNFARNLGILEKGLSWLQ
jgi:predicted transposase YbfD/YdcC